MSFADLKKQARQVVHGTLAVPALYSTGGNAGRPISVRWHNKLSVHGDLQNEGYASIIEGINHLVFAVDELAAPSDAGAAIVLTRGDVITIPDYQNAAFELDVEEPTDGPVTVRWSVALQ